jgi:hypothetical protein
MKDEDKRNFKRYESDSICEVTINNDTYKGKVIDYSDGISVLLENAPQLASGEQGYIKVLDSEIELDGEVVWIKEIDKYKKIGFKRVSSFKGNLQEYRLADILIGIQRSTRTGVLEIESGSFLKKILIENGDVIFAASNFEDDRLGELLLKEGRITLEEYNQASRLLLKKGERLGKVIVELGYLTPKELYWAVQHQIEEIVVNLFTIEGGKFEFKERPHPSEEMITLQISAANLIYRGMKKINNFSYIKQLCPSEDTVLTLSPNPLNIFQSLMLEDPDKKILSFVNGIYPLKTILALSPLTDFDTLKSICAFLVVRLIREKSADELPVELTIDDVLRHPEEEITEEFLQKIKDMYNKCKTLGYYEVLGIDEKTSNEDIKKVFYELSKQFHPDRHFSLPPHDVKEKLTDILLYFTEAYETLTNPIKRQEYDRTLSPKAPVVAKEKVEEPSPPQEEAGDGVEEHPKGPAPVQLPEDIQAAGEPGVPEEEGIAEKPAEQVASMYGLDAEEYGEKAEESRAEVSPPEEVPAPEAPPGEVAEEHVKGPAPVQLPEDIQAAGEPGVPEEEGAAEEPAEKAASMYGLDAEGYGEKAEESWAEVSPPEEVPALEAPPGEGAEEFPKGPAPVDLPEDIWAQVEGKPVVPEEEITVEENAEDVKVQEPVKALYRETEQKKDRKLREKTVKTSAHISVFLKKGRSKKMLLYVPIMFIIFVLLGVTMPVMYDVYDDIKKRFLSSEPVSTTGVLPSFREDELRNVSDEYRGEGELPSFREDAFRKLLRE